MTPNALLRIALYIAVVVALVKPLGTYMARVYEGKPCGTDRLLGWLERLIYRAGGIRRDAEMTWTQYSTALLVFNFLGLGVVYLLQRVQHVLPMNPQGLPPVAADSALNTAISFATNTNWQGYSGESTMSYLTQTLGLAVQNFLSAATGMAVLVALIHGFVRRETPTIGNFWINLTRSVLYILLPLSLVLAAVLVTQGVVQSFDAPRIVHLIDPTTDSAGNTVTSQVIPIGPVASQVAIKQLGTNGGGFFNANSAHPLENPTPLSNFLQVVAIVLIPASLCYTFGRMVGDVRQGWAVLAAMMVIFIPLLLLCNAAEQGGNPGFAVLGVDQSPSGSQSGGNMEGKEVRFGIVGSAIWASATTAASNGSVNAMHDSFTPLGGLVPLWLMQLGEVVFGGVGSGLYGMLVFAVIAVFIAGLMVGRTPEYLGKKIEAFEMKMAALVVLIPPLVVLVGTAIAMLGPGLRMAGPEGGSKSLLNNPGAHGFSEVLYAFSSAGNNNGSAFAGLNANVVFYNIALGVAMFVARYWLIVPILALAGSLAKKRVTPTSAGTLPTHTPLFVVLLVGTVIVLGALTFIPALALGPAVEHLQMTRGR